MSIQKRLEHFLKWVDEQTFWKEDNDIPNHVIVMEYMKKFKLEKKEFSVSAKSRR